MTEGKKEEKVGNEDRNKKKNSFERLDQKLEWLIMSARLWEVVIRKSLRFKKNDHMEFWRNEKGIKHYWRQCQFVWLFWQEPEKYL